MGLFGRVKKAVNRTVRKVENFAHRATGQSNIGEKAPEDDARSKAASQMVRKGVQKQAGEGQINYNTEELQQ